MLGNLSNLAKTIDDTVTGFISFVYRVVAALFLVALNPFYQSVRQFAIRRVSSRSVLFVTVASLSAFGYVKDNPISDLSRVVDKNLFAFLAGVLIRYVILDLSVRMLSFSIFRQTRRKEFRDSELIRYAIASSYVVLIVFQRISLELGLVEYFPAYVAANSPKFYLIIYYVPYPLCIVYANILMQRVKKPFSWPNTLVVYAYAALASILSFSCYLSLISSASDYFPGASRDSSLVVQGMECEVVDTAINVEIVFVNNTSYPIAIEPEQFQFTIDDLFRNLYHKSFPERHSPMSIVKSNEAISFRFVLTADQFDIRRLGGRSICTVSNPELGILTDPVLLPGYEFFDRFVGPPRPYETFWWTFPKPESPSK